MNLVMLETGQPLHAFDAETLAPRGKEAKTIYVRHARKNEKFETLDNQNFELDPANTSLPIPKKLLQSQESKGGKIPEWKRIPGG
jgi:phenylalanyl-tRNA synthetase beta subunit